MQLIFCIYFISFSSAIYILPACRSLRCNIHSTVRKYIPLISGSVLLRSLLLLRYAQSSSIGDFTHTMANCGTKGLSRMKSVSYYKVFMESRPPSRIACNVDFAPRVIELPCLVLFALPFRGRESNIPSLQLRHATIRRSQRHDKQRAVISAAARFTVEKN